MFLNLVKHFSILKMHMILGFTLDKMDGLFGFGSNLGDHPPPPPLPENPPMIHSERFMFCFNFRLLSKYMLFF